MNPDNTRRLALEVIARATHDMRHAPSVHLRIDAVVWLASRAATPWFDLADIDQLHTLRRAGWETHATALLGADLLPAQRSLIRSGILAVHGKLPRTPGKAPRTDEDAHTLPEGHPSSRRGSQA